MKITLKRIFYWVSIVRPIFDVLVGTYKGIKNALQEAKDDDRYYSEVNAFCLDDIQDDSVPQFLQNGENQNGK